MANESKVFNCFQLEEAREKYEIGVGGVFFIIERAFKFHGLVKLSPKMY